MQVDFYQLTRDPAEQVIPAIAQKILDGGGRLLVVSQDAAQLDEVSAALWGFKADSFLAHAKVGQGDDAVQPILLSDDSVSANGARFVVLADGVWREAALQFDRAFYLFAPDATGDARAAWRTLAENPDVERKYWKQDGGKWRQGP
jgi:DNA polymerase III subunit chi